MNGSQGMNTDKNFIIVTYDIVKTKHRTRVMKILKGVGFHVQKSVFECYLNDRQLEVLKVKLSFEIDDRCDGIRFYKMAGRDVAQVDIIGVGNISENNQLVLV